jgi:hypothetical protein
MNNSVLLSEIELGKGGGRTVLERFATRRRAMEMIKTAASQTRLITFATMRRRQHHPTDVRGWWNDLHQSTKKYGKRINALLSTKG